MRRSSSVPSAELTEPLVPTRPLGLSPACSCVSAVDSEPVVVKLLCVGAAPLIRMLIRSLLAAASALKFHRTATCTQVSAAKVWAAVSTERTTPVLSVTSKNRVPLAVFVSANHWPLVCVASSNCTALAPEPLQAVSARYQNITVPWPSIFTPESAKRTPVRIASTVAAAVFDGIDAPRHTLPLAVACASPSAVPPRAPAEESCTWPAPPGLQAPCSNRYSASGFADGT